MHQAYHERRDAQMTKGYDKHTNTGVSRWGWGAPRLKPSCPPSPGTAAPRQNEACKKDIQMKTCRNILETSSKNVRNDKNWYKYDTSMLLSLSCGFVDIFLWVVWTWVGRDLGAWPCPGSPSPTPPQPARTKHAKMTCKRTLNINDTKMIRTQRTIIWDHFRLSCFMICYHLFLFFIICYKFFSCFYMYLHFFILLYCFHVSCSHHVHLSQFEKMKKNDMGSFVIILYYFLIFVFYVCWLFFFMFLSFCLFFLMFHFRIIIISATLKQWRSMKTN